MCRTFDFLVHQLLKKTITFLPKLFQISATMVHFKMWVQYIFSIKKNCFSMVCISEQDIISHQGLVLHHIKFIQRKHLKNSMQYLKKKYQGFNCSVPPALALDPPLISIRILIPKFKWILSSMGRKSLMDGVPWRFLLGSL